MILNPEHWILCLFLNAQLGDEEDAGGDTGDTATEEDQMPPYDDETQALINSKLITYNLVWFSSFGYEWFRLLVVSCMYADTAGDLQHESLGYEKFTPFGDLYNPTNPKPNGFVRQGVGSPAFY